MSLKHIVLIIVLWALCCSKVFAQTCCSGGVPISGKLGLPPGSNGTWQISLSYDLNVLKTLKEGTETLDDDARERITQSIIFQAGYSLTSKWSTDLFFSYVKQERTIRQFGNTDYVSTNGIGDAALLLKYSLSEPGTRNFLVTVAAGPKIPTGRSDLTREDGIPLNADLQPGSGSWDGLFWINGLYKFRVRPSLNTSTTVIYSLKGKNNDYLNNQTYQFGDEIQVLFSINDSFVLGQKILNTSLILRYRKALEDRFNDIQMPNTGGEWIFLSPSLAYNFSQKIAIFSSFEIPVYAKLHGTQLSPTYRFNVGMFIKFNKNNEILEL